MGQEGPKDIQGSFARTTPFGHLAPAYPGFAWSRCIHGMRSLMRVSLFAGAPFSSTFASGMPFLAARLRRVFGWRVNGVRLVKTNAVGV